MSLTAFNPNDPTQTSFLSALALGETGGSAYAPTEGVGGVNLSGAPTDAYGFPQWAGQGGSHAAGIFQDQPGTWADLAKAFNLNFQNPEDQMTGNWILAQKTYNAQTGGDLETALQNKSFSSVQAALKSIWPSVTGNAAAPAGLANDLSSGLGATGSANTSTSAASSSSSGTGLIATIENFFVRFGLIIVGALLVLIALWVLLSDKGVLPSPQVVGKGVLEAVAA